MTKRSTTLSKDVHGFKWRGEATEQLGLIAEQRFEPDHVARTWVGRARTRIVMQAFQLDLHRCQQKLRLARVEVARGKRDFEVV